MAFAEHQIPRCKDIRAQDISATQTAGLRIESRGRRLPVMASAICTRPEAYDAQGTPRTVAPRDRACAETGQATDTASSPAISPIRAANAAAMMAVPSYPEVA